MTSNSVVDQLIPFLLPKYYLHFFISFKQTLSLVKVNYFTMMNDLQMEKVVPLLIEEPIVNLVIIGGLTRLSQQPFSDYHSFIGCLFILSLLPPTLLFTESNVP